MFASASWLRDRVPPRSNRGAPRNDQFLIRAPHRDATTSFHHGAAWNKPIRAYMSVIPPSDAMPWPAEHNMYAGPTRAFASASAAKVGAAASCSQPVRPGAFEASPARFGLDLLVRVAIIVMSGPSALSPRLRIRRACATRCHRFRCGPAAHGRAIDRRPTGRPGRANSWNRCGRALHPPARTH